MITIKKGLNLPISGAPRQEILEGKQVSSIALVGYDYHGMKPTMLVREGDKVIKGQPVFTDKKNEGVIYTSPAAGTVKQINRGAKRVFQSLVIEKEGTEAVEFKSFSAKEIAGLNADAVVDQLVQSGQWTALRTRPYSKVPAIDSKPKAIFVQAMDTNPLAADPEVIIAERSEEFKLGLQILTKLTEGKVWLCKAPGANIATTDGVSVEEFAGVHPAGNPGTHIHFLDPVTASKTVWTIGYQDVIAFGHLFSTGQIDTSRVISLAGPEVKNPRLVRTEVGADLETVVAGEVNVTDFRTISGSVFGGRTAEGPLAFLGRYHTQVSILRNDSSRPMVHFLQLGRESHSVKKTYLSSFFKNKLFNFSTTTNGSERGMIPIGQYEQVMPLDILATQLLRAIVCSDLESAEQLGALELDEEDLALCTYVCFAKYEYGPILRDALTKIEAEG
ncbi:Na(+)-translocating NADH-quinone reductase subunit A [Reinekea marinisedimentorum]|uniref:Na(+)-translocating NADH-quinone reductase subunit A n=1 Tax=Reinekea marinisedimentorum TaxID=230495 RepID=A0A4R3I8P2_9GAMM|nr:Na(+)-translocating NADH-quinone reductase subunit A [Reinekea marinisedimentorum]TCS42633.1 Na+-transporting NADH:ubiquinone oxidoreductase subunit A [Reinekea marinisedimentorum]